MEPPILIIGNASSDEFHSAFQSLEDHAAEIAADLVSALRILRDGFAPALVVVAQRWPGEFSHRELNELKHAAPLARIIGVNGSWLEGEPRTGTPWPTMLRSYWHQGDARLSRELALLSEREFGAWRQPATCSDGDRIHFDCPGELCDFDSIATIYDPTAPLIAIYTGNRDTATSLADLCKQQRWNTLWLRELPSATPLHAATVLFDVRSNPAADLRTLSAIKSVMPETPIIALAGFPRIDDVRSLESAGVAAIVSKPFLAADLVWQIEQALALQRAS
jgi:CheY-like chemotaxis protein